MFNSKNYWENRYSKGRTSGTGSYGKLAEFKSNVINKFISDNDIESVVEFGCGDGNQLEYFKFKNYIGYDVSDTVINKCKEIFKLDKTKSFYNISEYNGCVLSELTLSLDVIFHLVEDDVFEKYMNMLFSTSKKYVIIYSSNGDCQIQFSEHLKDRKFTNWIDENIKDFKLIKKIDNAYQFDINNPDNTSISDFYIYEKRTIISI